MRSKGRIHRSSSVPYYAQLRAIILAAIDDGDWRVGELIPSEAELTSTFGISRTVIRKALDLLTIEGRIRRIKGKGTVVVEPSLWDTSPELTGPYGALAESYRIQAVIENRLLGEPTLPNLCVLVISERASRPGVAATLSRFDVAGDAREFVGDVRH